MPDLGTPIYVPSANTSISDIDLHTVLQSQSQTPTGTTPKADLSKVDTGYNTAIGLDYKPGEYGKPLRTFDEAQLKTVSGYNSFKDNPTYNPELSNMQNLREYAGKQGKGEYVYNLGARLAFTTVDSAINAFNQNFRNIDALTSLDIDKLYSKEDNSALLELQRNLHPTYGTGENDDSWRRFNPFTAGKADFYGEFVPQLGFTLGTIGETVAENLAITALTGGLGTLGSVANSATKFQKLMKGANGLFEAATGITNFKKGLHVLNSIKYERGIAGVGDTVVKGAKLLANGYAMYNTAAGEASFEANNRYNESLEELKADYVEKNGFTPFGQDLEKIKNSASSTAQATFGWNLPILLGSNLIQFGNILKPFKGVVAESVENQSLELIGKGLNRTVARSAEKEVTSKLARGFGYGKNFFLEAGSEGLEEVAQSYVSTGSNAYYKDIYNGLSQGTALNTALAEMWSYTGSKTFQDDFFGGFIGGAVFSGIGAISNKTGLQEKLGFDSDKSKETKRQSNVDKAITILNETSNEDLVKYLFNPDVQNYLSQVGNRVAMQNAASQDNQLAFIDARDKSVRDLIYAGLQTGKLDLAINKLDVHKELDNEDLATLLKIDDKTKIGEAKERATKLVDTIKEKAYTLQSDWNNLNRKYKNPYKPGTATFVAYEEAKKERLFARDIIQQDKIRSQELRNEVANISEGKVTSNIVDQAVDNSLLNKQVEDLQYFVDNAPDKTDKIYTERKTQLDALKEIQSEKIKENPDYGKLAELLLNIGTGNSQKTYDTDYQNKVFTPRPLENRDEILKVTSDLLKLEDRNKYNVGQYEILNNRPIDESVAQHLMAQALVINEARKAAASRPAAPIVDTTSVTDTTTQNETVSVASVFANMAADEQPSTLTIEETEEQKSAEEDRNEGSMKMAAIKFAADKSAPSEFLSTSNPIDNQYHRRKDQFLEKLHLGTLEKGNGKFWKKDEVRVLIVTPTNAGKYGKNLTSVMSGTYDVASKPINEFTPQEYAKLDNASIMYLFVEKDTLKPITVDGTTRPKLDGSSDYKIQDLIYSFNESSTEDNYKGARVNTGEDVNKLRSLHRNQRLKWLTSEGDQLSTFQISHGLPNMEKKNGQVIRMQNTVQDAEILPSDHTFNPEDVYIPTAKEEFERTNTNSITDRYLRPGRPYLAIRDGWGNIMDYQKLENAKFTANQKGAILYSIKSVMDKFFSNDQTVEITDSNEYFNFLKHVLFLQTGKESDVYKKKESIYFKQDPKSGTFTVMYDFSGTPKTFTFHKGANTDSILDDSEIKTWLDNRYMNILKPTNKKFKEFYVTNKQVKEREWDNYSEYLLSDKTPTGSQREVNEIPLKVELYTPQQQDAYYEGGNKYPTKRKQYYVKLGDRIVDDKGHIQQTPKKETAPKPQVKTTGAPTGFADIGQMILNNILESVNDGTLWQATEAEIREKLKIVPNKENYEVYPKVNASGAAGFGIKKKLTQPSQQQTALNQQPASAQQPETESNTVSVATIFGNLGMQVGEVVSEAAPSLDTVTLVVTETQPEVTLDPPKVESLAPGAAKISLRGKTSGGGKTYNKIFRNQSNYSRENITEIKSWFNKNLPQVPLEIVNNLIKVADNKLAWGTFSDGIVTVFEEAVAGTGYHEGFEAVFNGILTSREQQELTKEFGKRKGSFTSSETGETIKYSQATFDQAREEIAEEFMRFKLTGETFKENQNIFQRLWNFLLGFVRNLSAINDVFSKLDKGYYANKEIYKTNTVYTKLVNVGPVEVGYYLKGMTYEMINDLFSQTKSFTKFDESFSEKEMYDKLYSQLQDFYNSDDEDNPNTYRNVLGDVYISQINDIENNEKMPDDLKSKHIEALEIEYTNAVFKQRERFNTVISFQWNQLISEHKKYLKQLGVINFVEVENEADDDKNSNDYTRDSFKIDIKATAPRSIKLLFNTIAESTFDFSDFQTLPNGLNIPLIKPKTVNTTGLVNLYDSGTQLFNIVLSQVAEINTLDGIKAKLEEMLGMEKIDELQDDQEALNAYIQSRLNEEAFKNNSVYTHLFKIYSRIFATPEGQLTKEEWKQRLQFVSTFSKQKPEFWQYVSGATESFVRDELRDSGRKQIANKWFRKLNEQVYDRNLSAVLYKSGKKNPYVLNDTYVNTILAITDIEEFILKAAKALGMEEINGTFFGNISPNEKKELNVNLRAILNYGINNVWNGKSGKKIFSKLNPNALGVSSPYNDIADLVLDKRGDEFESVHSNIEGEQQQNIIQNNEISNRLASFNRHKDLASYVRENPEFNDTFVRSSVLLNKLFNKKGIRTNFKPKISTISGTIESNRDTGKKSSNQNLTERLYQEFNVNLDGKFYILLPADAETEWGINLGKERYINYTDDVMGNGSNIKIFTDYLKSEIESAQQFVDPAHPFHANRNADEYLSTSRPLKDGSERKVGASLQIFKDILSDELVAKIHKHIDNLELNTQEKLDAVMAAYEVEVVRDLRVWLDSRVTETFKNLNRAQIVERTNREAGVFDDEIVGGSLYTFYGLNSTFNRDSSKFPNNVIDGQLQPNQYNLTSQELRNLIAYREMSYFINNVEMTKLFVGNPYFYKDILKRVKSFLSTTESTYVQNEGDTHKADDWFNIHLNTVANENKEIRLPSSHTHNHLFSSSLKTWVFRDHETLNKELSNVISTKYSTNNATDAQSLITPNSYREFYWKSGGKFRDNQEKQFQVEQAFERFLLDQDGILPYEDAQLRNLDSKLLKDNIRKTANGYELTAKYGVFEVFKPKGSGTLGGLKTFDPYIWKTSVSMINYRMVRGTPMQSVYLKMLNEGVNVLTFESAIKVGMKKDPTTGKVNSLFEVKSFEDLGKISNDISSYVHELPFKSVGLQVETSGQKTKATIGTQTTKIILTDLFEYGVPTDFEIDNKNFGEKMSNWFKLSEPERVKASQHYRLEKQHREAIQHLEDVGYYELLDKLGIKEVIRNGQPDYQYENLEKVYALLKGEMVKRGLSANLYDMFEDQTLKVKPLEALSNYAQASFIIMSIVRKSIVKPKLNGGQKILASSFGLNQLKEEGLQASYYDPNTKQWVDIEVEEDFIEAKKISEKNGTKIMYNSSQLRFYSQNEDGSLNVMEVMLPNVFREKLEKKRKALNLENLSDEELLNWLAKNQPRLLEGIGFRIPTQALSSIDTFKIKGFLPSYFGDTVVVPSELTTKVGSDFDVDKLNTYLNNFVINSEGYPTYIKADLEDSEKGLERRWNKYNQIRIIHDVVKESIPELTQRGLLLDRNSESLMADIAEKIDEEEEIEDILMQLDEEGDPNVIKRVLEANGLTLQGWQSLQNRVDDMLTEGEFKALPIVLQNKRGALENNYFSTIDKILKLPQNFKKMLAPNNSDEFDKAGALRDKIMSSLGKGTTNLEKIPASRRGKYINYSDIVDSNKMRYNRWAFVIGKKGVGIAALSTTNHVNSQKIGFKLNRSTSSSSWWSPKVFGQGVSEGQLIKFDHNQLSTGETVLSGITKVYGQNIAEFVSKYVNGYVDIAKDAWILDIGAQMEVAGIYLFMERLGIDSEEIIYFLNQPVIKYYLNVVALRNSPIKNINPSVKEKVNASRGDEAIYDLIKKSTIGSDNLEATIRPIKKFNMSSLRDSVEKYSDVPFTQWKNLNIPVAKKEEQFLVFRQFLQLKDYSNYVRASQQASNHDTANLNSLHILDDKEDTYDGLMNPYADNLITTIERDVPMVEALRSQTFVGNVINRLNTLDNQFLSKDLFRIQARPIRRMLKNVMMKLNPYIYSENDRREMMDKITKVAINSLVLNTDINGKGALIDNLDSVMKKDYLQKTLDKVQAIVKNADGTIKAELKAADIDLAHIVSNRWITNLSVEGLDADSDFGYYTLSGQRPNDNFEKQIWLDDFRKLKQLPFTQNLYKQILAASIYQAGAEHNRSSLLDLIPWEDYTPIINNGLNNVSNLMNVDLARTVAKLKTFDRKYFTPLEYIGAGNVNGKKYYSKSISLLGKNETEVEVQLNKLYPPSPGDMFHSGSPYWLQPATHSTPTGEMKEISSVVLVPKSNYYNKMSYFTLKQQDSSLSAEKVKEMKEAKNFDYFTTILLEKAPLEYDNGLETYMIFRPINTTGHRYIQETLFNNEYSKLDNHEKVNPFLTNDDVLYKLLKGKFGDVIKKTESFPEEIVVPIVEEAQGETTEDANFEEVPDEMKQLPSAQPLLENTDEAPFVADETSTRDITDTEAARDFVDKTMKGESTKNTLASPDDKPSLDKDNVVEGTCE